MELFLILLTGFFLWLLIYDGSRRSFALLRTEAGALICSAPIKGQQFHFFPAMFFIVLLLINVWLLDRVHTGFDFFSSFNMSIFVWFILASIFPPFSFHTAFEIHEKGLVSRGLFAPWCEIRSYQVNSGGLCQFTFHDFSRAYAIPSRRKEEIKTILQRMIETRSFELDPASNDVRPHPPLRRPRFQFDLRSLLIFFIFASTLSSLGGIHYHRWEEKQQTVAALEPFHPKIEYSMSEVWQLDFSQSAKKPSDDDLPLLLKFPRLRHLDLTGAPITDAGLEHLAALKNSVLINLTGTRVTQQGVDRLRKALSKHSPVIWMPPPAPPIHTP
jgi:hypothetical protein